MEHRNDLDSRAARPRGIKELVRIGGTIVLGEPVFCTSCGRHDGYVPVELPPGVIYLCGDCEAVHGVPPAMTARTDLDAQRSH